MREETPPAEAPPESGRGREARWPHRIPLKGWRDILWRIGARIGRDYVSLMAAGVAFFALVALFPAIAAVAALAAMFFEPGLVADQIEALRTIAPAAAVDVVESQATTITGRAEGSLGLAALVSLAISLFSASRGVNNLIDGINMAHAEEETRGIIKRNLVAVAITLVLVVLALVALGVTLALPALAAALPGSGWAEALASWARWPVMALFAMVSLALVYRYAPARTPPRWSWASPGAVVATALWVAGSVLFSLYVRNFGAYNPTYGALAGVVILLLWMWLSSFVVLLGAQLNAEMEHQTRRDTTRKPVRPMGERGAYMADTLGRKP
ncbi:hypothetical protein DRV85_06365 [Rhodosalinus halophilus]|uniref:YihY/virulence factor BrkB family protein n=1 Tax=Rhodosalinus halophilus TaxID=2259333 RepID=A0A365UBX0_9RHOB|nr:hypothetical protein DRV85_06365 [Rhodosalinus halophilus]